MDTAHRQVPRVPACLLLDHCDQRAFFFPLAEVLELMVRDGEHAIALKYVHKFGFSDQFPPEMLVGTCVRRSGELTVRTCALLLKYVKVFNLERIYPMAQLLQRVGASGVTVRSMMRNIRG